MFLWDPKTTGKELASALKVLSAKYPALSTRSGKMKLVFKKGGKATECSVKTAGDTITVTYSKVNMALRMLGAILSGTIPEKKDYCPFEMFGVMIDCSRDAVPSVGGLKRFLKAVASMGYNVAMLYTEDTYEIEGRPYFGYMRGRYTKE